MSSLPRFMISTLRTLLCSALLSQPDLLIADPESVSIVHLYVSALYPLNTLRNSFARDLKSGR